MIAKLIVHGVDREHARRRMLRALDELVIEGVPTLVGFHKALLTHPCFVAGETCHGVTESELLAQRADSLSHETTTIAMGSDGAVRMDARRREIEVAGKRFSVRVLAPEPPWRELGRRRHDRSAARGAQGEGRGAVVSPMQGTVLAVNTSDGASVDVGDLLCVIEAMKMENEIRADRAGIVAQLAVGAGEPIAAGQTICVIDASG
jgi:acetyl-CoA/propionyl-CoA carboxylase biotin carboxyl carrier protein